MATLPYWNNGEVISSDKLNSMVASIIAGDPLAIKVSNATKNDVNQIISYLSSLYNSAKTNLNSATSTSSFDTAYTNMTALVSNKLGAYANDDTVDLYSTGIRASIITFLQAYDTMMSNDRLSNKNTDNTLGSRINSETEDRENADNAINTKISDMQANGGGRNLARNTSSDWVDFTGFDNKVNYSVYPANIYLDTLQVGDTMTWGITLKNTGITSGGFVLQGSGNVTGWNNGALGGNHYTIGNDLPIGTTKTFVLTTVITNDQKKNDYFSIQLRTDNIPKGGTLSYRCIFAEKGTVAHDWTPAPEDTNSAIESMNVKADANTASISKITSVGGGINLFKDTNKMTNTDYWGLRGYQSSLAYYGSNNPASRAGIALSDYNVFLSDKVSFIDYIPQIAFEQGTDYTVSFWTTIVATPILYLNANDNANHQHNNSQQNISLQASGRVYGMWKQVTATFKPKVATAYLTFAISSDNNNTVSQYWASSFKLEKGIVAHDWSPSPQDIQSQIDNLNANKISSSDVNWGLVANNSSNTYSYPSGSTINLPSNSSITLKSDRIVPRIYLPTYLTDYLPSADLNNLATFGEYDNLFVSSATMATLSNRPTNPDTGSALTGDCFFTNHYAYSGTTVHAFQKLYSCDYNYVFIRSYKGGSSAYWTNWSCLTPYA